MKYLISLLLIPLLQCINNSRTNKLQIKSYFLCFALLIKSSHPCTLRWKIYLMINISITGLTNYLYFSRKKSPRRGIEPRSPAWQAGILTTILSRIRCLGDSVWGNSFFLFSFFLFMWYTRLNVDIILNVFQWAVKTKRKILNWNSKISQKFTAKYTNSFPRRARIKVLTGLNISWLQRSDKNWYLQFDLAADKIYLHNVSVISQV